MERIITITPAWDRRSNNPEEDFGVHCCDLRMVLKGKLGATQFILYTGWYLPGTFSLATEEKWCKPMAADIGYHSPTPMHEGQLPQDNCPYLDGKPCYYDGSGLRAEAVFDLLLRGGSDAVWKELENEYVFRFGKLE